MEAVINRALAAAKEEGIRGKATTPFLLAHIKEYTKGVSLASNLQLAYNNAREAGFFRPRSISMVVLFPAPL